LRQVDEYHHARRGKHQRQVQQALAAPQAAAIAAIASRSMGKAGEGFRGGFSLAHDIGQQAGGTAPA
jgi:hypothetical protein